MPAISKYFKEVVEQRRARWWMRARFRRGSVTGRATQRDKSLGPRRCSLLLPPGWSGAAGTNLPNGRDLPEGSHAVYQSSCISFHIAGLLSLQLFPSTNPPPPQHPPTFYVFWQATVLYLALLETQTGGLFFTQADLIECIYFVFRMMLDVSVTPDSIVHLMHFSLVFQNGNGLGWVGAGQSARFHKLPTVVL